MPKMPKMTLLLLAVAMCISSTPSFSTATNFPDESNEKSSRNRARSVPTRELTEREGTLVVAFEKRGVTFSEKPTGETEIVQKVTPEQKVEQILETPITKQGLIFVGIERLKLNHLGDKTIPEPAELLNRFKNSLGWHVINNSQKQPTVRRQLSRMWFLKFEERYKHLIYRPLCRALLMHQGLIRVDEKIKQFAGKLFGSVKEGEELEEAEFTALYEACKGSIKIYGMSKSVGCKFLCEYENLTKSKLQRIQKQVKLLDKKLSDSQTGRIMQLSGFIL